MTRSQLPSETRESGRPACGYVQTATAIIRAWHEAHGVGMSTFAPGHVHHWMSDIVSRHWTRQWYVLHFSSISQWYNPVFGKDMSSIGYKASTHHPKKLSHPAKGSTL
ncbi:hypothetical protein JTE90_025756 [Oedothorax gibbosus]|uniref:Uncharacterized protein n=1 Tax=Oedothorax gibbosus TaxID=931172 RepID=A0AAV6U7E9_9ARAC|nr:hypothetical protein JTE90_025756 [Oedothorax gibbosus]